MTDKQFNIFWSEALASDDRESFVSDWTLSSIWGDEPETDIPGDRAYLLDELWRVAHMSIRDIRDAAGPHFACDSASPSARLRTGMAGKANALTTSGSCLRRPSAHI